MERSISAVVKVLGKGWLANKMGLSKSRIQQIHASYPQAIVVLDDDGEPVQIEYTRKFVVENKNGSRNKQQPGQHQESN